MKGLCFNHFIFPSVKLTQVLVQEVKPRGYGARSPAALQACWEGKRLPTPLYTLSTPLLSSAFCFYCKSRFFLREGKQQREHQGVAGLKKTVRQCCFLFSNLLQAFWPFQEFGRFRDSPKKVLSFRLQLWGATKEHTWEILPHKAETVQLWKGAGSEIWFKINKTSTQNLI